MNYCNTNLNIPGRQAGGAVKPCGRLWPNGEFSFGYQPAGGAERLETPSEYASKWDAPLGLAQTSNSHKVQDPGAPRRGTKGLTSYGKKMLRNCVWRMQRLYGKRRLAFVTLTLPDLTYEEHWTVASNWAEIVRVFYQKLGRRLAVRGLPRDYAGCTEMQPTRAEREEVPALHLHFIVVGRRANRESWALHPRDFRRIWASVVGRYVARGKNWSACENVGAVRKDASSYMSKYVSKGCSMAEPPRGDEIFWSLPTAWYNAAHRLKKWVASNTRSHPILMEYLESASIIGFSPEAFHYLNWGTLEKCPGPGPHFCVGRLRGDFQTELLEFWNSQVFGPP